MFQKEVFIEQKLISYFDVLLKDTRSLHFYTVACQISRRSTCSVWIVVGIQKN